MMLLKSIDWNKKDHTFKLNCSNTRFTKHHSVRLPIKILNTLVIFLIIPKILIYLTEFLMFWWTSNIFIYVKCPSTELIAENSVFFIQAQKNDDKTVIGFNFRSPWWWNHIHFKYDNDNSSIQTGCLSYKYLFMNWTQAKHKVMAFFR